MEIVQIPIADIVGVTWREFMGDLSELRASIRNIGLIQPIGITVNKEFVFGSRRIKAFVEEGHTSIPAVVLHDISDAGKRLTAERDENLCRLEPKKSEYVAIAKKLKAALAPAALARKQGAGSQYGIGRPKELTPPAGQANSTAPKPRRPSTDEKVASVLGLGETTLNEMTRTVDNGIPAVVEAMDNGTLSTKDSAKVSNLPKEKQEEIMAEPSPKAAAKKVSIPKTKSKGKSKGKAKAPTPTEVKRTEFESFMFHLDKVMEYTDNLLKSDIPKEQQVGNVAEKIMKVAKHALDTLYARGVHLYGKA